jgi:Ca2+-binding RTX toxin-like protein
MEAQMQTATKAEDDEKVYSAITEAHFGLNFVAEFEGIGSKPWERFDEIVARLNFQNLRYPGGVSAETAFDYRNPNNASFIDQNGISKRITPLSIYLEYCNREKIDPTVIVPTAVFLTPTRTENHRTFDESQAADAYQFIEYILSAVDSDLTLSLEIGNEYESHMTSVEYGRVAHRLTEIIASATSTNEIEDEGTIAAPETNIFVQAWSYSAGGGLTVSELIERNARVIDEFNAETLAEIDGVVSHYYYANGRNVGTDQEQTFERIEDQIKAIARLHSSWSDASGRDLASRVSEWNVQLKSTSELGLMQISPMMEMFTSFLENGMDQLDFWSAQYHATSIASSSGRMMAAGVLFDTLKPYLIGTQTGVSQHSTHQSTYTFVADGRLVSVLSSEKEDRLLIDPAHYAPTVGLHLVDGYIIGVDEASADGVFKELEGLRPYGEPDATITVTQIPVTSLQGGLSQLFLDSYETLILIFSADQVNRRTVFGTEYADLLYASGQLTQFVGQGSTDIVSYVQSTAAVYADLQVSNDPTGNYEHDIFVSIEVLLGSAHNDVLRGSSESNRIDGWSGDDLLVGSGGQDTIGGGSGNDTIRGGSGNDQLNGGPGDDHITTGGGLDSVFGGEGFDTVTFADSEYSVTYWISENIVETMYGAVVISGLEVFTGSALDDIFVLGGSDSTVHGLAGNDEFRVLSGGRHLIYADGGDDAVFVHAGLATVYGGSGDDTIFAAAPLAVLFGGDGNDLITVLGVGNIIDGGAGDDHLVGGKGADTFVFSMNSGNDTLIGFQPHLDAISLQQSALDDVWFEQTDAGSVVFLGGTNSILLELVFIDDVSNIKFVVDDLIWA